MRDPVSPGPWTFDPDNLLVVSSDGLLLADAQRSDVSVYTDLSNLQLMATSWAMRDAIYAALDELEPINGDLIARSRIVAAITALRAALPQEAGS